MEREKTGTDAEPLPVSIIRKSEGEMGKREKDRALWGGK
jgi:hypothetical protein